jgi:uncharacterized lipoprotein YehR (DUF1307 family)
MKGLNLLLALSLALFASTALTACDDATDTLSSTFSMKNGG